MYSWSVYGQRCGQIRVPNDWYVVMISGVVKALENRSAGREETDRLPYVVNFILRDDKHVVRQLKQPRAENCLVLLLQVLYCNLQPQLCQVLFSINSALKIWYAVSKEKARRDHFHHVGAKPLVHAWWIWSHFAFRSINTHVRTQKLICIKQRKGGYDSNHI